MNDTKKKILIVDDDSLLTQSLEQSFCENGNEVRVLDSGDEVITTMLEWNPDIVLLDIMLPGKNGVEIVKEISVAHPALRDRVVMMTTLADNTYLAQALECGITNYVQKNTSTPQYVIDVAMRVMNK